MTDKENILRTIRRDGPAWVPHRYDWALSLLRANTIPRAMQGGVDDWGVRWTGTNSDEGSYPDGKPVLGIDEVESFQPPRTDWPAVTENMRRQVAAKANEDTLLVAYNEMVLFERAQLLLGTTGFLTAVALEPEKLEILLDKIADYGLQQTRAPDGRGSRRGSLHRRLGNADRAVHLAGGMAKAHQTAANRGASKEIPINSTCEKVRESVTGCARFSPSSLVPNSPERPARTGPFTTTPAP